MTIRIGTIDTVSTRLNGTIGYGNGTAEVTESELEAKIAERERDGRIDSHGGEALRMMFRSVRDSSNGLVTREAMHAEVTKAVRTLSNLDKRKANVHDGYIDNAEVKAVTGAQAPIIGEVFKYAESEIYAKQNERKTKSLPLTTRASLTTIRSSAESLKPVTKLADELYAADPHRYDEEYSKALNEAIKEYRDSMNQPLSALGARTLRTALSGSTHYDSHQPYGSDVNAVLDSAVAKLKNSDGAVVVDFDRDFSRSSEKDGEITALEVDRSPQAVGHTLERLLEYAESRE